MKAVMDTNHRYCVFLILKDGRKFIVDPIVADYAKHYLKVDAARYEPYQFKFEEGYKDTICNLTNTDISVTITIDEHVGNAHTYPACTNNPIKVLDSMPKLNGHCDEFESIDPESPLMRYIIKPLCAKEFIITSVKDGGNAIYAVGKGLNFEYLLHDNNISLTLRTTYLVNGNNIKCSFEKFAETLDKMCSKVLKRTKALICLPYELLFILNSTPQDSKWHPEGNVADHIELMVWASGLDDDLAAASVFHDLGKMDTTEWNMKKGKWTAYGHEDLAKHYIDSYGDCLNHLDYDEECVRFICENHMRVGKIKEMSEKKAKALRESPYFDKLWQFHQIDGIDVIFNF